MTIDRQIDLSVTCEAWHKTLPEAEDLCRRAAAAALAMSGLRSSPIELSLVLSDDASVRALNRDYRGRDSATNVLSFRHDDLSSCDTHENDAPPTLLGDIVLAYETVVGEAEAQGKPAADHLCHLVVHGVLHLLGYDHETSAEAAEMERLEVAILSCLGVDDPYTAMADQVAD
jgi:probable rRNA maturation factor